MQEIKGIKNEFKGIENKIKGIENKIKGIENKINKIETILDEIINLCKESGDELEDYFVYISMVLASDKLNGRIKQETTYKIEELREMIKMK